MTNEKMKAAMMDVLEGSVDEVLKTREGSDWKANAVLQPPFTCFFGHPQKRTWW